ncbi:probably inactive leucine-rich repeat receptor-like protein kinase At5g48380 isoform X2 [Lathyrus oleraceus]|nr:probably inactive leucine-rich repeat receptor-like protein kinase At5g48380 isoform X2 [Pisum sativum]XP_050900034.1 probably inactive leucine-rich repeat receptor-like protein kinase At5g48380 isoform X2 [Pisum sativum]
MHGMTFQIKRNVLMNTFLWGSFLCILMTSRSTETDILCLKSIKNSLEDPNNYLQSWNFNNKTEGFICRFIGVECWHPDENRVLNLKLSNMGLKGQFPRGIVNCSSLTGLDLSINELSGTIPYDISVILHYVTTMDLSNNKFTGEIPIDLANCTYLNVIKLDNNILSGEIPKELGQLTRLKVISVANNNGLCGGSLRPCFLTSDKHGYFHQSFKDGLIVGYVFALICFVIINCMFYFKYGHWVHLLKMKKNKTIELGKYICSIISMRKQMVVNQIHELLQMWWAHREIKEISVLYERLSSTIWMEELHYATDCFSMDNAIGVGKMGMMYEGFMPNGTLLAIKRLFDYRLFKRQFLLETTILCKYRHKNIIPLLGFCIEGKERLLTYAYMSNGRLSKWLNPLESEVIRLKWHDRVNIALGIARGLSWLHHICDLCVVHLNISSECILLDENFEPKISNFGEAKFMNPDTEDHLGRMFKANDGKKDVYDFGSVLFELITGKTYNELSHSYDTSNICGDPLSFYNVIDKSLSGEGLENEVCTLLKIACECVKALPNQRPTMLEVYNNISNLRKGRDGSSDDSYMLRELELASSITKDETIEF